MTGIWRDIRFAVRVLAKNKGFAATALLTLALCIGANTAIFSMLYALVMKPLPYENADRIVEVTNSFPKQGLYNMVGSTDQYLDFREHADAFARLAAWMPWEFTLGIEGEPTRCTGAQTTAEMFDVFGLKPALGRFFAPENSRTANNKVVVLAYSFWESQFQKDPSIIGRKLPIDGEPYQVIGVAPRSLEAFNAQIRIIIPLVLNPFLRYSLNQNIYGRLKPDTTISAACAQLTAIERKYYESAPAGVREILDRAGHIMGVDTVQSRRIEPLKVRLYLLQGGVLLVLLIGCINVANLLLARSNARRGELAVRLALGAARRTIWRQLFIESFLLAWLGAILGLAFAWGTLGMINHFVAQRMPTELPFAIDGRVLGFTMLTTVFTALAIGLFPVLHVLGDNLLILMRDQSRSASGGRGVRRMSSTLVVAQVAAALMLLVGAGLLIRSFANVLAIDTGFNPRQLIAARIALSADYRRDKREMLFQQQLLDHLREVPGFTSVSLSQATPFTLNGTANLAFWLRESVSPKGTIQPTAMIFGASPSYLETIQLPLIEGRWFNAGDTDKSRRVFVVNQGFVRHYFPNRRAVGQHITFTDPYAKLEDWPEIIGVVGNTRDVTLEEGDSYVYSPLQQSPAGPAEVSVLIRSSRPISEVIGMVRQKVKDIDPALPVFQADSMEDIIRASFIERRAITLLLCSFAGIALLLSAVGIYGVLAYDVSQRKHEIGIRGAIGANRRQVTALILRQGLWKAGIGLAIGITGALYLGDFLRSLLFEVTPTDPIAYAAVSLLLLVVALLASYLPARRAARIDPMAALRTE
jgi:predicted permease